jgi:nitrogen fixation NifU-like protein
MDEMYRENILDHGMNPRNSGVLDSATIDHKATNPLCGDQLRLTLRIDDNNIITEIGWEGQGCAVSQAAASMLGEEIIGKRVEEVRNLTPDDVYELLGIPISQNRVKCALLGLKALHVSLQGLDYWRQLEESSEAED